MSQQARVQLIYSETVWKLKPDMKLTLAIETQFPIQLCQLFNQKLWIVGLHQGHEAACDLNINDKFHLLKNWINN